MSNKKQTAVQWYIEERNILENALRTNEFGLSTYFQRKIQIEDQAKAMEREQIIDARQDGIDAVFKGYSISNEEYYNETFKTGQNESE
jgi:Rps23 Pro-64 3,4-dihydroxylase Tpa1-like proline 4-hydroxylase